MQFKMMGQDRIPTGLTKQLAAIQQTITQASSLSNTPMWYDGSDINSATAVMQLGGTWWDQQTGNAFKYVKASATFTPGQLVGPAAPTTGTVTASGSTVYVVKTNITTTANEANNLLWFLDAAGTYSVGVTPYSQSLRSIVSQTNGAGTAVFGTNTIFTVSVRGSIYGNNQYDPNALPAVPTNASAVHLIRPFNVGSASGVIAPIGVTLGEVTSGNYTVIQVAGLALIQAINTTAATVIGTPGSVLTGGVFTGTALATVGAAGIIPLYAIGATQSLIPAYVNFLGA